VDACWSKGEIGFVRVKLWASENLVEDVIDYTGPTVAEDDSPPYMVIGPYLPGVAKDFETTVVFSDLRVGDVR
jgi:hypothetical protein